jgi:glycosyltransferase involved in cell wall biosynthesis
VPDGTAEDRPRSDVELLAQVAGTDVVDVPAPNWSRRLENLAAADVRHVLAARSRRPAVCLSFTERLGAPAALLLRRARHVVVAHNFNRQRQLLERLTHWMRRVDVVVVVSRRQRDLIVASGVPAERVVFVPDYVDTAFFDPAVTTTPEVAAELPTRPYVLAVGQEERDYEVLLGALADTSMDAVIVPSSSWVQTSGLPSTLPSGVSVRTRIPYPELRALYAAAAVVVVPVHAGTEYAAGVNGLLEALSMGRPVVVTRTPGLSDYLDEGCMDVVPAGDRRAMAEGMVRAAGRVDDDARRAVVRGLVLRTHTLEAYVEALSRLIHG